MVVEIHEDLPLVEPGTAWIKQLWLPMTLRPQVLNRITNPAQLVVNYQGHTTRQVPIDFTSLTKLDMVVQSSDTAVHPMTTTIRFGKCGELYNVHLQTVVLNPAFVLDVLQCIDLLTPFAVVLANLEAGDNLWIQTRNDAGNIIYCYGIDMRYT